MAEGNMFQGDMDPEIAALLGTDTRAQPVDGGVPDYSHLFGEAPTAEELEETESVDDVDLNSTTFPEVTNKFADVPHVVFDDPSYYKTALAGEGDKAQRVHGILQKFLNTKDPKDRGVYRQQLITAYWDFLKGVARKAPGKLADQKKYLLRFGLLHPTLLDSENRGLFSKLVIENVLNQPIYYLDEWFKAVGTGQIRSSTTDEVRVSRKNAPGYFQGLLDKAQGKFDGAKSLLKAKEEERSTLEGALKERIGQIVEHDPHSELSGVSACYTEGQRRLIFEVQENLKSLLKTDHDLEIYIRDYFQAEEDVKSLQQKVEEEGAAEVDVEAVDSEFNTIRQMAKMTIGRQGNHFPILTSEYYHCLPNDLAYRENIISVLTWVEKIDPEAFCRTYRNRMNRIIPYIILIPSYGDYGMCWEPFDKFNRATSRGRIAVPMYSKNIQNAVLSAVADFRWQVAKEKASYYWMEEGITGNYYQYFQKMKLKGDLKESFIDDYIIWITKESEGTQRLDKELRGAFWRHMPFSQQIKEKLKTRSYIYQELYQRDLNRAMSDGY